MSEGHTSLPPTEAYPGLQRAQWTAVLPSPLQRNCMCASSQAKEGIPGAGARAVSPVWVLETESRSYEKSVLQSEPALNGG